MSGLKRYASLLILALTFSGSAVSEEPPEEQQAAWLDNMQDNVSASIDATVRWFDSFFIDETQPLDEAAKAEARLRLGWEPRSRDLMEFESRFRVRVRLPNMKHQTDLIFSDYDEDEQGAGIKAARNEALDNRNRFSMALRFTAKKTEDLNISHRIGVGRKLQPYVKSEIRKTFGLSDVSNLHLEGSVYYYTQDRFGSRLRAQYSYQMDNENLLRFDNNFYFRDKENDWIWQHGLHRYQQLDPRTGLIYGIFVEGNSQPYYRSEEFLLSARWRRNAVREWLFFELEPFVLWRRDEDFKPSYGLAMRVEAYFGELN